MTSIADDAGRWRLRLRRSGEATLGRPAACARSLPQRCFRRGRAQPQGPVLVRERAGRSDGDDAFSARPRRSSRGSCRALHHERGRSLSFYFRCRTPISIETNLRCMRDARHGCDVDSARLRLVVRDACASESRRGRKGTVATRTTRRRKNARSGEACGLACIKRWSIQFPSPDPSPSPSSNTPAQPASRSCLYYGRRDS